MYKLIGGKRLVKVLRETYTQDIPCGCSTCTHCMKSPHRSTILKGDSDHFIMLGYDMLLHQLDILGKPHIQNVIIPQTCLNKLKDTSLDKYKLIRQWIKNTRRFYVFSNEFHSETVTSRQPDQTEAQRETTAVFNTWHFYKRHLPSQTIYFVTDDVALQEAAKEAGILHISMSDYAHKYYTDPELIDSIAYVAQPGKKSLYQPHISHSEFELGLLSGQYVSGPLRQDQDNWLQATIPHNNAEILIPGRLNMNRALDGDMVVVELYEKSKYQSRSSLFIDIDSPWAQLDESALANKMATYQLADPKAEKLPTGRVVAIKRALRRPYCGTVLEVDGKVRTVGENEYLVKPLDQRIPFVRIRSQQIDQLRSKRIIVAIDCWDVTSEYPCGHYISTIGAIGDKDVEAEALLVQYDVSLKPFADEIMAELPEDKAIHPESRIDLRHLCVCSIDPPGCTDIDDALHVRILPNGNYQVGVHIADVSHYVVDGSHMDEEARKRGSSVYLVDRRIDMLPTVLGEGLCSINQNVDRYAFSVIWELSHDAQIIDTQFCKSIIRSRASLSYAMAQERIDDISKEDELTEGLRVLMKLSKCLKDRRMLSGALTLASAEAKFIKDEETNNLVDMELYQTKDTHSLVEEFMLLANISVAEQIYRFYPAFSMLRRHPPPILDLVHALNQKVARFDIHLDGTSSQTLSNSVNAAKRDESFDKMFRMMVTRCMSQARYFSSGSFKPVDFWHFGLACPIYTHFTSPIRRYADVVVHRLLAASIGYAPLTKGLSKKQVQRTSEIINRRNRMADHAGRDSTRYHTFLFLGDKTIEEEATVMKLARNGVNVFVMRHGFEGKIYFDESELKDWKFEDSELVNVATKQHIKLFDRVTIRCHVNRSIPGSPKLIFEFSASQEADRGVKRKREDAEVAKPGKKVKK